MFEKLRKDKTRREKAHTTRIWEYIAADDGVAAWISGLRKVRLRETTRSSNKEQCPTLTTVTDAPIRPVFAPPISATNLHLVVFE